MFTKLPEQPNYRNNNLIVEVYSRVQNLSGLSIALASQ